jgi:hypothetical protein
LAVRAEASPAILRDRHVAGAGKALRLLAETRLFLVVRSAQQDCGCASRLIASGRGGGPGFISRGGAAKEDRLQSNAIPHRDHLDRSIDGRVAGLGCCRQRRSSQHDGHRDCEKRQSGKSAIGETVQTT